ncbi:tyrosine kinase receptor Cad96Ca-like [Ptychodera flava]|uniref:tyrosine kinase receptor Cad96Ca-like n=1 Tax=Ptychodera flava TaxID=63121 RepID=UPI00396A2974
MVNPITKVENRIRRILICFDFNSVTVEALDDESGILEIRWQVIGKKDSNRVYGEGKIEDTSPIDNPGKPCTGLTCACLPHDNLCFYLKYLVAIDTTQLSDFPNGKTECVVRITVVNNAMLETSDEVGILLGSSAGSNAGVVAGAVVGVVAVIAIIVVILIVLFRRGAFTNLKTDGLDNLSYEQNMQAGTSVNNYTQQQKVMNTAKVNDSAMSRDEMEFSASQLVLKDKLKPGIHEAKATNIAGKKGDSLVVVKALKDVSSRTQREHLLNELDIMLSIIPHENIIRLLGCITQSGSPKPSIIMEFAPYGNLGEVLKRSTRQNDDVKNGGGDDEDLYVYSEVFESKNSVTSEQLMLFAEQIVIGLDHLASQKIIHRKLGVRNVLLGDGKICKIAAFSYAIRSDKETVKDSLGGRLPIRWMAPESLVSTEFSLKSDVWTYGIVLWEIITLGALPYPGLVNKEISEHIKHGQRMGKPPHCTDEIYSLMLKCWAPKPKNRPSCAEILAEIRRITKNEDVVDLDEYDGELYGDINDL